MKKIILLLILSSFVFTVSVDHNMIHKQIKSVLKAALKQKYKNIDIQVLKRPKLLFPDEIYNVEVRKPKKLVGMTTVQVLLIGKTKQIKLQYLANVKIREDVLIVARSINRKTALSKRIIEVQEKDITNQILAKKTIFKSKDDIAGLRTKSFLKKGDILTRANTETIPDILKNREMSMKISKSNLSVTMRVKTLEEGFIGDIIKVMNEKYKKVLLAQVINGKEVVLVN